MVWLVCFSITVGSADSDRDLSLSFVPVLSSKTFSLTILMSSQVQLAPMPAQPAGHGTNSPAVRGRARLGCSGNLPALCFVYKF